MWRKIFNTVLFGSLLLTAAARAQEEKLMRAQQLLKSKQSDLALVVIDSVIAHPQTREDFVSWTTRAFIYFDLYKRNDKFKLQSPLRDSIISSVLKSERLKPDSIFRKQNRSLLTNIAAGYYNLGKTYLQDSLDHKQSQFAYDKYKEVYRMADPSANFNMRDIEYNLAVGSIFLDVFMKDTKNTEAGDVAKLSLLRVLETQPDNHSALLNMGLMYYNQAAFLTQSMSYETDLESIDAVQDNLVKLARQAEQFVVKVYNEDNKNEKAVQALYFIYRMLLDFKKSDEFKAKCIEMGIDISQPAEK